MLLNFPLIFLFPIQNQGTFFGQKVNTRKFPVGPCAESITTMGPFTMYGWLSYMRWMNWIAKSPYARITEIEYRMVPKSCVFLGIVHGTTSGLNHRGLSSSWLDESHWMSFLGFCPT